MMFIKFGVLLSNKNPIWQNIILISSIKEFCLNEYSITCFILEEDYSSINQLFLDFLEDNFISIHILNEITQLDSLKDIVFLKENTFFSHKEKINIEQSVYCENSEIKNFNNILNKSEYGLVLSLGKIHTLIKLNNLKVYKSIEEIYEKNYNNLINNFLKKYSIYKNFYEVKEILKYNKKRKIILHFGIHRTGTTNIQNYLHISKKSLLKYNYMYPDYGDRIEKNTSLAWMLMNKKIDILDIVKNINLLPHPEKIVILSDEDFCQLENSEWLSDLKKYFEIKIIIYLRRQDLWLESWYNQNIRWPWMQQTSNLAVNKFLELIGNFHWLNYELLLKKIEEVVGFSNLYVNVLDRFGVQNTAVDFLNYLNIPIDQTLLNQSKNESIDSTRLEILRHVDLISVPAKQRKFILENLQELVIKLEHESNQSISDSKRMEIYNSFRKTNNNVAKKYLDREVLFSEPVYSYRNTPNLTEQDIIMYLSNLIKLISRSVNVD